MFANDEYRGPLDGRFVDSVLGGLTYTGIVHVTEPAGATFAGTHVADVQSINEDGTITVSLHLESGHPAVQDAIGDGIIQSVDEGEWIDRVPLDWVRVENDTRPFGPLVRTEVQRREQAKYEQARSVEREENIREHRAGRGPKLPALAELDASNAERERVLGEPRRWWYR